MSEWIEITDVETLERKKKDVVTLDGAEIALFYADGQVYALNNICIHKQRKLSRGLVFKGKIVCPGHQWAFDLKTGWVDEWEKCQPTYKIKVENGKVFIDLEPRTFAAKPPSNKQEC